MKEIAKEIDCSPYLISGNGSIIYNLNEEKTIYTNYLQKEKVLEIIKICEENSIFYSVFMTEIVITKSLKHDVAFYSYENTANGEMEIEIIEDIYEYVQKHEKEDFLKITICDNNKIIFSRIMDILKQIGGVDVLDVGHMSTKRVNTGEEEIKIAYFYTEITNENANKWTALQFLMKELGISSEEIMVIGDNVNDEEMIRNAGMGIAMGNSYPALKEMANDVVADNNKSGVAEAINKHINNA